MACCALEGGDYHRVYVGHAATPAVPALRGNFGLLSMHSRQRGIKTVIAGIMKWASPVFIWPTIPGQHGVNFMIVNGLNEAMVPVFQSNHEIVAVEAICVPFFAIKGGGVSWRQRESL